MLYAPLKHIVRRTVDLIVCSSHADKDKRCPSAASSSKAQDLELNCLNSA